MFDFTTHSFTCHGIRVAATRVFQQGNLKRNPFLLKGGPVVWTDLHILQTAAPGEGLRVRKGDTQVALAAFL